MQLKVEDSTALKGLAILLMIFHHCYRTMDYISEYSIVSYPFSEGALVNIGSLFKVAMCIFAFVSGYGLYISLKKNDQNPKPMAYWIKNRLLSTLSGYWFIAVLSYIAIVLYNLAKGSSIFGKYGDNWLEQILSILADILGISKFTGTTSLNGSWWYMSAAILTIVMAPILYFGIKKIGGFAVFLIIALFPRIIGMGFPGSVSPYTILEVFVVGMICSHYHFFEWYERKFCSSSLRSAISFAVLLVLTAVFSWSTFYLTYDTFWEYKLILIPLLLIILFTKYVFRIKWIKAILKFLGKYSMTIWLIHTFFRDYFSSIVWSVKWFLVPPLIILVMSLLVSIGIEYFKKLIQYNKWFQMKKC